MDEQNATRIQPGQRASGYFGSGVVSPLIDGGRNKANLNAALSRHQEDLAAYRQALFKTNSLDRPNCLECPSSSDKRAAGCLAISFRDRVLFPAPAFPCKMTFMGVR